MQRQLKTLATLAAMLTMAAVLFALPTLARAFEGEDMDNARGRNDRTFNPTDAMCVETHAPYFTHRVPVIYQDLRSAKPDIIGWGYAEACSAINERYGETYASTVERPEMFQTSYHNFLGNFIHEKGFLNVLEALPGVEHPGDNGFFYPLPPWAGFMLKTPLLKSGPN